MSARGESGRNSGCARGVDSVCARRLAVGGGLQRRWGPDRLVEQVERHSAAVSVEDDGALVEEGEEASLPVRVVLGFSVAVEEDVVQALQS